MLDDVPKSVLYLQAGGFVVSLVLYAMFALLETTVTALRLFKLKELANSTKGYKRLFEALEFHPHKVLFTILIAGNLVNTLCIMLITSLIEDVFSNFNLPHGLGLSVGITIATAAITIFGEILPKNIAKLYGDRLFRYSLWLTNAIFVLLSPVVKVISKVTDFFVGLMGKRADPDAPSENEVRFLIDYIHEKGLMDPHKTAMLQSIFRLSKTPVKEIMVPETDIISVPSNTTVQQAVTMFITYRFSRLPVYDEKHDNIIGIIYQKDIFFVTKETPGTTSIKEFIRPVIFVPENIKVNQLLRQFKQEKMHMAIVLNEFGGVEGLVTLENVLEEIVGPIVDETELIKEVIIPLKDGGWLVDGSIPLDDLGDLLRIIFEAEDAITLGGFLTEQLQRLPAKGESMSYLGYTFLVQKADQKRVMQVLISPAKE